MGGVTELAEAMGALCDINIDVQTDTAYVVISWTTCYFKLTESWTVQLKADMWKYFTDSLTIIVNPSMAAGAAADYMVYTKHSSQMGIETGSLNTLMQTGKSQVQADGDATEQVYNMMEPIAQLLESLVQAIMLALA